MVDLVQNSVREEKCDGKRGIESKIWKSNDLERVRGLKQGLTAVQGVSISTE
jgi:hypothetical protein